MDVNGASTEAEPEMEEAEEVIPEPELHVKISTKVTHKIDASIELDDKRTLKVKSQTNGIRLTVATRVKVNYYTNRTESETMLLQDDEAEYVIQALQAVVDARKVTG